MAQGACDNEAAGSSASCATSASCQVPAKFLPDREVFSFGRWADGTAAAVWMPLRCQAGVFGVGMRRHMVVRPSCFVLFPQNLLSPSEPRLFPESPLPHGNFSHAPPNRSHRASGKYSAHTAHGRPPGRAACGAAAPRRTRRAYSAWITRRSAAEAEAEWKRSGSGAEAERKRKRKRSGGAVPCR
jgi:hypothetical protein